MKKVRKKTRAIKKRMHDNTWNPKSKSRYAKKKEDQFHGRYKGNSPLIYTN